MIRFIINLMAFGGLLSELAARKQALFPQPGTDRALVRSVLDDPAGDTDVLLDELGEIQALVSPDSANAYESVYNAVSEQFPNLFDRPGSIRWAIDYSDGATTPDAIATYRAALDAGDYPGDALTDNLGDLLAYSSEGSGTAALEALILPEEGQTLEEGLDGDAGGVVQAFRDQMGDGSGPGMGGLDYDTATGGSAQNDPLADLIEYWNNGYS